MSSTAAIVIVIGIVALATFLLLLPRIVGRREARRLQERPARRAPVTVEDAPPAVAETDVDEAEVDEAVVDDALVAEIDTGVATGTVEWVSLRMTRLRDADGVAWHVPNGEIKRVANFSQRQPSEGQPDATRDGDLDGAVDAPAAGQGPSPQDEGRRDDR